MKTTILFFLCLFFSVRIFGQTIVNYDFETWTPVPNSFGGMDPQGWKSTNAATAGANVEGISMSPDKYSGTYALALSPLSVLSATDTLTSAIVVGQAPLDFNSYQLDYAKGGQTFTTMASSVNGFYKYTKGTSSYDSAYAVVLLKNALGNGYKGIGKFGFAPSTSYIPFQINIVPQGPTGGQVDSLVIAFFYKSNNQNFITTGKLLIDSLYCKTAPVVATAIKQEQNDIFSLFPNPFGETFNIKFKRAAGYKIEVFSGNGSLCLQNQSVNTDNYSIDLSVLGKGIYFLRCTNLQNGDFLVKPVYKE